MLGCRATLGIAVAAAVLNYSCAAQRKPDTSEHIREGLARLREDTHKYLAEAAERQTVSPEDEAARRTGLTPSLLKPGEEIWLQSGKSRLIQLARPVRRVAIGNPELASVVVISPRSLVINAKAVGGLQAAAAQSQAQGYGFSVGLLSTTTSAPLTPQPRTGETSLMIWTGDASGGDSVDTHTLMVADFTNQQVMLEVTVAEVDRTALEQHGIDFRVLQNDFYAAGFMGGAGAGPAGVIPSQPLLPLILSPTKTNYAFIWPDEDVSVLVQLLEQEGLATILAQPKLVAMSGQQALFQSGGEIPIRVASGFAAGVEFKPFGTLVRFVPRVSDDGEILLTVTPEVSIPDFANLVEGIPTFRTRRASTSTRLRNAETLVIGGLLQTETVELQNGVPYLKDIPYLGYAFRRTENQTRVTELMVIVTPKLVHPIAPGTQIAVPTDGGPLTEGEVRTRPDPAEVTRPRLPLLP